MAQDADIQMWKDSIPIKLWLDGNDKRQAIYDLAVRHGYEKRYSITQTGGQAEDFYLRNMVAFRHQMKQWFASYPRILEIVTQFHDALELAVAEKSELTLRALCVPTLLTIVEDLPCEFVYETFWHSSIDPQFYQSCKADINFSAKLSEPISQAQLKIVEPECKFKVAKGKAMTQDAHQPQYLQCNQLGALQAMAPDDRWQALFEWAYHADWQIMTDRATQKKILQMLAEVEPSLKEQTAQAPLHTYPFPVGQSETQRREALQKQWRLNYGPVETLDSDAQAWINAVRDYLDATALHAPNCTLAETLECVDRPRNVEHNPQWRTLLLKQFMAHPPTFFRDLPSFLTTSITREPDSSIIPAQGLMKVVKPRHIHELKSLNDWQVEAGLWFIRHCPFSDNARRQACINSYLDDPVNAIKQEIDASAGEVLNRHGSPSFLLWKDASRPQDEQHSAWVDERLQAFQRVQQNGGAPLFSDIAQSAKGNPDLRLYDYATLFERLLLHPPEWIKPLSEHVGLITDIHSASEQKLQVLENQITPDTANTEGNPESPLQTLLGVASHFQSVIARFKYGSNLTPEELKRREQEDAKVQAESRQFFELHEYGRVLSPVERREALKNENLKRKLAIKRAEALRSQGKSLENALQELQQEEVYLSAFSEELPQTFINHLPNKAITGESESKPGNSGTSQIAGFKLEPGHRRTMKALKEKYPDGFTVNELLPLTVKDSFQEQTSRGSQDKWCGELKREGYIRSDGFRPQRWFFVKDL